jgi:hypothetical protein
VERINGGAQLVDDLKRQLDAVDNSPTVQAVLLLAGLYVRYLVWKMAPKVKKAAKKVRRKMASD